MSRYLLLLAFVVPLFTFSCSDDNPSAPPKVVPGKGQLSLLDDGGVETNAINAMGCANVAVKDLTPNTFYEVTVSELNGDQIAKYRLTTNGRGELPETPCAYDLEEGVYVVGVTGTTLKYNFSVTAPVTPYIMVCTSDGTHANSFANGETVYLTGAYLTPGEAAVFVVDDKRDWAFGDVLYDYGDGAEAIEVDAQGAFDPAPIWAGCSNDERIDFDVILDMNNNGVYDSGDVLDSQRGTGFVVQDQDYSAVMTAFNGHVIERLSSDVNWVYKDYFTTDEDVYVWLNPKAKIRTIGTDRYVHWVIVSHQDVWNDQDPLTPVRGRTGDTMQNGCTNAGRKLVWPRPLTPGQYDIVLDVDRDGLYDLGEDIIDGYSGPNSNVGFTVVAENRVREWTVLIYADGEGGLHDTRWQYKDDVAAALDNDTDVNVVILFDGDGNAAAVPAAQRGSFRYIVTPDDVETDADMGELNMGDPLVLEEFLTWGITRFPANHYVVALSNHGGSWFAEDYPVPNELDYDAAAGPSSKKGSGPQRAVCYDGFDGLNMYELDRVFRNVKAVAGGKLDILWYQCCLMGGVEIASVSDAYFDYMVSHETVRFGGENTDKWTNVINAIEAGHSVRTVSCEMTTVATRPTASFGATYDLAQVGNLESRIRDFVTAVMPYVSTAKSELISIIGATKELNTSVGDPVGYPYETNRDLFDFFDRVSHSASPLIPDDVKTAASRVCDAVGSLVIETEGNDIDFSGIALWLPENGTDFGNLISEYVGFDFSRNTDWQYFIASLHGISYRIELTWGAEPRDLDSHLYDAQDPPNHIYYANKTAIPGAYLDLDDVTGYGPENIRIMYLTPGPRDFYEYKVYLFSGYQSSEPSYVKVFRGGSLTAEKTYTRTWDDDSRWWNVFTIDVDTGDINDIDVPASVSGSRIDWPAKNTASGHDRAVKGM